MSGFQVLRAQSVIDEERRLGEQAEEREKQRQEDRKREEELVRVRQAFDKQQRQIEEQKRQLKEQALRERELIEAEAQELARKLFRDGQVRDRAEQIVAQETGTAPSAPSTSA